MVTSPSIEQARLYRSIKARLFDVHAEPVRVAGYRVERRLGCGGMGEVFLAHDDELDRPVALKLVHARLGHDPRFGDRMRREARALAKLVHPNVVHVYEVSKHEGRFFLAMEYVEGQTLGAWIDEAKPSWSQVLEAYLAAGEGLAAAHAVGLVHRDFKPENVLRGVDGRVCVADFGLARFGTHSSDPDASAHESWEELSTQDERLSTTGAVIGTPRYMPLEQLLGGRVDARSDQFAFCVALYEGLWGRPPHVGDSLQQRELALTGDRPVVPPRGVAPGWLWPIIRRGLERDPARRWPDMPSLLEQLRRAPLRRRVRRRAATALLGLSAAAVGTWLALPTPTNSGEACVGDAAALTGTWDPSRRRSIRQAFTATGLTAADETATRVEAALDDWRERWLATQLESCVATRHYGTQSARMLDRRAVCLDRQRQQVAAIVAVFATADADVVARANEALLEIPELGACSSAALESRPETTVDPQVDAGYEALARARVALRVGRPEQAAKLGEGARAIGETSGHVRLTLEAKLLAAKVVIAGGELEPGIEQLRSVALAAERAKDLELVADARVALAQAAAGRFAEPRLERWLIDDAQLAVDRVAREDDPRAVTLLSARAQLAERAGDFDAAIATYEAAYALAEGCMDDAQRALIGANIGNVLLRDGDLEGARARLEQSLEIVQRAWGRAAPEASKIEFNLAMVTTDLGELDLAQAHLDAAITVDEGRWGRDSIEATRDRFALAYLEFARGEIDEGCRIIADVVPRYEAALGRVHDETASAITAAAVCRHHAGDFEGAIAEYRRVLPIQLELLGENHREIALLYSNIGEAQLALGRLDESLESHTRALEILDASVPADHPERAASLKGQAVVWLERGEPRRALTNLERALELVDASQPLDLAEIRFTLARALSATDGDRERARTLAVEALQSFDANGSERDAAAARAWLATH